jgi:glyoxylate reductase
LIYHNRKPNEEAQKLGYKFLSFEELLQEADILVCCANANKENENIFNSNAFSKMKKTSVFINVARGSMVNHDDLYEALKNNVIASAGTLKYFLKNLNQIRKY